VDGLLHVGPLVVEGDDVLWGPVHIGDVGRVVVPGGPQRPWGFSASTRWSRSSTSRASEVAARLEVTHSHRIHAWLILEAGSVSYGGGACADGRRVGAKNGGDPRSEIPLDGTERGLGKLPLITAPTWPTVVGKRGRAVGRAVQGDHAHR
jgi:hypothetical protein